jgi:ParB family chromosome partitioning protein
MAGLTEVPVTIMQVDDKKAAQVALIENIQREDLNGMEAAKAFKSIMESHEMTQEELSIALGKSRSLVANTLRLLDLPKETCSLVEQGKLTVGHARTLLGLIRKNEINETALYVVEKGLSVRQTEELVRKLNRPRVDIKRPEVDEAEKAFVDYTAELEKRMTALLGSKVKIKGKGKNRTLQISITDDKQLDELVTSLCGDNIFDN